MNINLKIAGITINTELIVCLIVILVLSVTSYRLNNSKQILTGKVAELQKQISQTPVVTGTTNVTIKERIVNLTKEERAALEKKYGTQIQQLMDELTMRDTVITSTSTTASTVVVVTQESKEYKNRIAGVAYTDNGYAIEYGRALSKHFEAVVGVVSVPDKVRAGVGISYKW